MHSSETALTYPKTPGSATTQVQEFEWTLAALLHLRGLNSNLKFHLDSNVKGAGAIDKIVFCLEHKGARRTTFVQLKHKESAKNDQNTLTNLKGDFTLSKYFKSYLEIKNVMSTEESEILLEEGTFVNSLFVIFTNTKGNDDWGEKHSKDFSLAEELLWSGLESVFSLDMDKDTLECLGECDDDGGLFLKQFRVFCGQPSGEKLKPDVNNKLKKTDQPKIKDLNIDRLCECFLINVKVWWEKRSARNDVLHKGQDILENALDKVKLEYCSEQTLKEYEMGLGFEDAALLELKDTVSNESSCRMILTKLWQDFEVQSLLLNIEHSSRNNRALLDLRDIVKQLVCLGESLRYPDETDCQGFNGPKFALGFYECNFVRLRFGQENAATALRVSPRNETSQKASFSNETNEDAVTKSSKFHQSRRLLSLKGRQLRWLQLLNQMAFGQLQCREIIHVIKGIFCHGGQVWQHCGVCRI